MKKVNKEEKQIDLAIEKARRQERTQSRFYISSFDYGKGFRAGIDYQKKLVNDEEKENENPIIKEMNEAVKKDVNEFFLFEKRKFNNPIVNIYQDKIIDFNDSNPLKDSDYKKDPFQQNYNCDDKQEHNT